MTRHRALVAGAFAVLLGLLPASPATAADAPNTRAGVTTTSPSFTFVTETLTAGDVDWYRFHQPVARWTTVLLGDLTADLRLDVYDAAGRPFRSLNTPGTRLEQALLPLPAGSWFFAVSGATAQAKTTAPYFVRFQPRAQGVWPVNVFAHNDENGVWRVTGEVLNNTPGWVNLVRVRVTYRNARGELIASFQNRTTMPYIGPRAVGPWEATMHDPPQGFASYVVEVTGYQSVAAPVGNLSATLTATKNTRSSRQYSGTFYNGNTHQVVNAMVAATFYDARSRVLRISLVSNPNPIAAKSSWAFTLPAGKPIDNAVDVSLYAR